MVKRIVTWSAALLLWAGVQAQDAYHMALQDELQNDYDLPAGSWVLNDTEAENLNDDSWYGDIDASNAAAAGQVFSRKVRIVVNSAGDNQWDAGYGISNVNPVNSGSACLLVIWLRSESGEGKVSLFVEHATNYNKEVYSTLDLPATWTRYLVPFDADQLYAAGGLRFGLHLAWKPQTIEIGGLAVIDYNHDVSVSDLPLQMHNEKYGGWEPDAPWRNAAADRIEDLRKADLTIRVQDEDGNPVQNASVDVEMLQHEFAFGSAVVSRLFAGNNSHNATYEAKLLDLDGEGHGFNWVVFENALKWPGWEQNWITSKPETAHAAQWLRDHDIQIRGHNLVWPGWSNMPSDIQDNQNDPGYVRDRISTHIGDIVTYPGIAGNIAEWDVLNEITTNRDLETVFQGQPGYPKGREIYIDIFNRLAEVDPVTKTYINDYVTISNANAGGGQYDLEKQFVQELIDGGVKLDGIGFQGHIGAFPTSIYDVKSILDDFHQSFGTTAKITEYDTDPGMGDELAATYLRDFLTMVFSHPSMDGFLMWGFWDGAHWHGNAPLYYQDWTLKPAGQTFVDLVFGEWWTEESGQTDASGTFQIRGFKGKYRITVDCGDYVVTDTINLRDDMVLVKSGEVLSNTAQVTVLPEFRIYPNPASDHIDIENPVQGPVLIRLLDNTGRVILQREITGSHVTIPLPSLRGMFTLHLSHAQGYQIEKIIILNARG